MKENKLTVNLNGKNVDIEVIDIIDDLVEDKEYIVYCADGYDDEFLVSILEEDEKTYTLKGIEDDEELKKVEDYIEKTMGEEEA